MHEILKYWNEPGEYCKCVDTYTLVSRVSARILIYIPDIILSAYVGQNRELCASAHDSERVHVVPTSLR